MSEVMEPKIVYNRTALTVSVRAVLLLWSVCAQFLYFHLI